MQIKGFVFNPFFENTYVVWDETGECVVIDPGCLERHEKQELKEWIEENGLKPVRLLNTHSHLDHVFGNDFVHRTWDLTPELHPSDERVYISYANTAGIYGFNHADPLPDPSYNLEEGQTITFGNSSLEILFLPGHCPGHVAFLSKEQKFMVSGDVLFQDSIGRTDLPGGDMQTLLDSIRYKVLPLDEDIVVYSGHGPETTIGREKRMNPFLNF